METNCSLYPGAPINFNYSQISRFEFWTMAQGSSAALLGDVGGIQDGSFYHGGPGPPWRAPRGRLLGRRYRAAIEIRNGCSASAALLRSHFLTRNICGFTRLLSCFEIKCKAKRNSGAARGREGGGMKRKLWSRLNSFAFDFSLYLKWNRYNPTENWFNYSVLYKCKSPLITRGYWALLRGV